MMELTGDQLSAIFGWISMGCWVVVYSPQLIENYRLQSGEGLSLLFLMAWIIGDACSISGAIIGGLVPSVIWLGAYHLLSDFIILSQVYYYRWKRSRYPIGPLYDLPTPTTSTTALASETGYDNDNDQDFEYNYDHTGYDSDIENTPLLRARRLKGRPGNTTWLGGDGEEEHDTLAWVFVRSIVCLIVISILGIAAWRVDEMCFGGKGTVGGDAIGNTVGRGGMSGTTSTLAQYIPKDIEWGNLEWLRGPAVQVLGWTSATLYISSNLPQIFKNFETRCGGLSPSLFVFNAFGSCTYVLSILAKSVERDYILKNAGWLAGHGISSLLDFAVIGQIVYYRYTERGRMRGMYTAIF